MNVRQSCHVLIKKTTQKDIFFGFCSIFRVLKPYYFQREFDAVHRILVETGPSFRKFQREFDALHRIPVENSRVLGHLKITKNQKMYVFLWIFVSIYVNVA